MGSSIADEKPNQSPVDDSIVHRIGVDCGKSGRSRLIAPTYNPIPLDLYPDCKQGTLQTSSENDSRVWSGVGYSRSVATGGSARVATGKRGGAGPDSVAPTRVHTLHPTLTDMVNNAS